MTTNPHDLPLLHVFGQEIWHAPVFLIGNRKALEQLRDSIIDALAGGHGYCEPFVNDGEGYELVVAMADGTTMDKLATPYLDPVAQNKDGDAVYPYSTPGTSDFYRRKREETEAAYKAKKAKEETP